MARWLNLFRLWSDATGTDKPVGWALLTGPVVWVLVYGQPARGLWIHRRAWLDTAADRG